MVKVASLVVNVYFFTTLLKNERLKSLKITQMSFTGVVYPKAVIKWHYLHTHTTTGMNPKGFMLSERSQFLKMTHGSVHSMTFSKRKTQGLEIRPVVPGAGDERKRMLIKR